MKLSNKIIINIIKYYQKYTKSIKKIQTCKFVPTCSEYSKQCFIKFSFFKALFLSIKRILKCNPFNKDDSFDPIE